MNRSQLFNQSWSIMIRHRTLWVVALIGIGIATVVNLIFSAPNVLSAIIVWVFSFATTAFTTGALISMVNSVADGQAVTVNDGIQAGIGRIVPLIAVRLLLMIPVWIVLFLTTGSFLAIFSGFGQPNGFQATNITALAGSFLGVVGLIFLLSLVMNAIGVGADRAVVLENMPVVDALRRGWQLLTSYLADYIVIGIMIFVVALAVGILFGCALGLIGGAGVAGLAQTEGDFSAGAVVAGGLAVILISAVIGLIVGVLMEVLFSGVWTLAFRKWQGK